MSNEQAVIEETATIIKFAIAPKFLKGMALFSSDDETRGILRSVILDYTGEIPVLVSTDGRRMGIYSLGNPESFCDVGQAKGKTFVIPSYLIKQIKGNKKQVQNTTATFEFEGNTVRMTLELFGKITSMTESIPEGKVFNWRQVLPTSYPVKAFVTLCLNGQYVLDFQKAGEWFQSSGGTAYPTFIAHGTEQDKQAVTPYAVRLNGVSEFYGVIMPVRISAQDEERANLDSKPDFLK